MNTHFESLTFGEFHRRFRPVANHLAPHAGIDGCLFETCGPDWRHVKSLAPAFVWTVMNDDDGGIYISSGRHFVNRLGYLVCQVPVPGGLDYEVSLDGADDEEENPHG
jgi:hypothetical protein